MTDFLPSMNNDLLTFLGLAGGMIVMVLTIVDYLIKFHDRFREGKDEPPKRERPSRERQEEPKPKESAPSKSRQPSWKIHPAFPYLPYRELLIIVSTGILLNYLGLMLSLRLHSILYLDMTGTALTAFLLGPWWGAVTALLSSSLVNWLLFPGEGADLSIMPWVLVNMTGGLLWGYLAQGPGFRKYLRTAHTSSFAHLWFLASFGLLGAWAMSIPGALLQLALGQHQALSLDQEVKTVLEHMINHWQAGLEGLLNPLMGESGASTAVGALLSILEYFFRYIPDKTVSVSIALIVVKYGFPLFEQELIQGGPDRDYVRDNHTSPLVLALLYTPVFLVFLVIDLYDFPSNWALWSAPWAVILVGYAWLKRFGPSDDDVYEAALARASRYDRALKPVEREPAYNFCRRLTFATLLVSALFVICLPLVLRNFSDSALNFLCVVYGFLLAVHVVHIAIAQNISAARADG
jgi:hypothetical protein